MFTYKLNNYYNVADYDSDYVANYLKAIGITKLESFLDTPATEDELDPYLLDNMDKAIKMLNHHIQINNKILVIVDSDPDGYTSSAMLYNYIKNINPSAKIDYILHEGKEHGIENAQEIKKEYELIIIPDAGRLYCL